MTDISSAEPITNVRKGRGLGKKTALVCTSIRLPKEVLDFFDVFPDKQAKMRDVLIEYVFFGGFKDEVQHGVTIDGTPLRVF
jgi:hypothetical protein